MVLRLPTHPTPAPGKGESRSQNRPKIFKQREHVRQPALPLGNRGAGAPVSGGALVSEALGVRALAASRGSSGESPAWEPSSDSARARALGGLGMAGSPRGRCARGGRRWLKGPIVVDSFSVFQDEEDFPVTAIKRSSTSCFELYLPIRKLFHLSSETGQTQVITVASGIFPAPRTAINHIHKTPLKRERRRKET